MDDMNRREALKSLAAAAGIAITPISTIEAEGAELIILRCSGKVSMAYREQLVAAWRQAVSGTALASVKAIVTDESLNVEIVRR